MTEQKAETKNDQQPLWLKQLNERMDFVEETARRLRAYAAAARRS